MSLTALLGNSNPQMQENGVSVPAEHLQQSVTRVDFANYVADREHTALALSTNNDRVLTMVARTLGADLQDWAVAVAELEQIVAVHSAGDAPDWVSVVYTPTDTDIEDPSDAGDATNLQAAIAKFYGCSQGEPTALLTTAGRDALHAQHMSTSAQPASFNYMALADHASSTSPAVGNTVLAGEIATGGGGLIRKQATYAHTGGTNTSTLTATFTANGSDALPVTIDQMGAFNAVTVGTIAYKTALNANSTLTVSGDSVTVTETVTAG